MSATYYQDNLFSFDPALRGPLVISVIFHLVILILVSVGLPFIAKDHEVFTPISVELVDISELTQTNKISAPKKPVEEPKPEPPPETKLQPPEMNAEKPPDLLEPKPPEVKEKEPEIVEAPPEPKKEEKKKEEPKKEKPKPPEPKKPPPKKEVAKENNDFASLLKNLAPVPEVTPQENAGENKAAQPEASQIARFSDHLTISEEDALRRQLGRCWNVPAGAKFAEELIVEIRVVMNPDRTVQQATILDQGRYNRDTYYQAAAEAALRALKNPRCTPLEVPPDKYQEWKTMTIRFDPSEML